MKGTTISSVSFFTLCIFIFLISMIEERVTEKKKVEISQPLIYPPCVEMHHSIEKYMQIYQVPRHISYGVAFHETSYKGPLDWNYNQAKISSAGALGPMQMMYATAKSLFPEEDFSKEKLLKDIDFNVHCSMKFLRHLYDKYGDWKIVLGAYNTGKPCVNTYAENVFNFKFQTF